MKIWLSDLTYTQQTISSDIIPAGIGMIAEYLEKEIKSPIEIKLFKYPEDLIKEIEKENFPDVFGASNYIWNRNLSSLFCKIIKKKSRLTKVVMGGPNFPTNDEEQKVFLKNEPWVDFYVIKEGEHSFFKLIDYLIDPKMKKIQDVPNLVYLEKGIFKKSEKVERIMDLTLIPSPYLSGRLNKFLDGKLMPVIQTNRGCPFSCTFCTEGQTYWSKVKRKDEDLISSEIKWISKEITNKKNKYTRNDLLIADSNFGMFNEDISTCKIIAEQQKSNGYPKYINVATGKNRKERVLEAAQILNGALKLAGSVQSLDEEVQGNIKRSNISSESIMEMALNANKIGANSYSEVILGLPGDSFISHKKTLKTLVEASFNTLSMYQLMMLPGTELNTELTRKKFKMKTKYRVLPRCFGFFNVLNEEHCVAEIEEILISNSTLSFDDYLKGRKLDFFVNVFYNDAVLEDLFILLRKLDISIWEWIFYLFENYEEFKFKNLVDFFLQDTKNELSTKKALEKTISKKSNILKFINGDLGNNLMFKFKSLSLTQFAEEMFEMVETLTLRFLKDKNSCAENTEMLAKEIIRFTKYKIVDIFTTKKDIESEFNFNIPLLRKQKKIFLNNQVNLSGTYKFIFKNKQQKEIDNYLQLFGSDTKGLTRILSRVYLKNLFRVPVSISK